MKILKNPKFLAGLGLIVVAAIIALVCLRSPAKEISRSELEQLILAKAINQGRVTPTAYAGIYRIEGNRKAGDKAEKVFITTHLDEAQLKTLFEQKEVKVEMPGAGLRGQWVNIICTVAIGGLVIMLVLHQSNFGKG